jgi:hypothetical protein
MQCTETKGLHEKSDDRLWEVRNFRELKRRDLLLLRDKPVFFDLQLLDFGV